MHNSLTRKPRVPHCEERPGVARSRRDHECVAGKRCELLKPRSYTARSSQEPHTPGGTKRVLRVRDEPRKPRSHTDCEEEDWAPGTHLADEHFRITHNVVTQRTRSCASGRRVGRVGLAGDLAFVRGRFEQCLRSFVEPPSPLLMRLASEQLVACAHQRKTLITEVGGMKKSPTPLRRTMSPGCAHGLRVKKCHPRKRHVGNVPASCQIRSTP